MRAGSSGYSRPQIFQRLQWHQGFKTALKILAPQGSADVFRTFVATSKFILSPSGAGFDCYRHWESMYMGAIPVVERSTMDRSFARLPVLLVDSYSELTPAFLEAKWAEMTCRTDSYDFSRLTVRYWENLLRTVLQEGSSRIVQNNHPIDAQRARCFEPRADWLNYTLNK